MLPYNAKAIVKPAWLACISRHLLLPYNPRSVTRTLLGACISRHLLLPYNIYRKPAYILRPASAGIYCFLITGAWGNGDDRKPASAGIYCFLITTGMTYFVVQWPASAGIYCFLITSIRECLFDVSLHQQAFIASL